MRLPKRTYSGEGGREFENSPTATEVDCAFLAGNLASGPGPPCSGPWIVRVFLGGK